MLKSIGQSISNGTNAAAGAVETFVGKAGDVVADIAETTGNKAQDAANNGAVATGGGPPAVVLTWLGSTAAGAGNAIGASIKGVFGLVGGIVAGVICIFGGALAFNPGLIIKGLVDIGSSIAGGAIGWFLTILSLLQRTFFLQNNDRELTKSEKDMLQRVFKDSIALYNVRVIEGRCGVFTGDPDRPFTLCNTIYFKRVSPLLHPEVLVHECTHVWQYQHFGTRYIADAGGAMIVYGGMGAYDWQAEPGRGHAIWDDFNREAQAKLIQDVWTDGSLTTGGSSTSGHGAFYDLQDTQQSDPGASAEFLFGSPKIDYTELATDATSSLRGNTTWRFSGN
jgi:hypothetical protein